MIACFVDVRRIFTAEMWFDHLQVCIVVYQMEMFLQTSVWDLHCCLGLVIGKVCRHDATDMLGWILIIWCSSYGDVGSLHSGGIFSGKIGVGCLSNFIVWTLSILWLILYKLQFWYTQGSKEIFSCKYLNSLSPNQEFGFLDFWVQNLYEISKSIYHRIKNIKSMLSTWYVGIGYFLPLSEL